MKLASVCYNEKGTKEPVIISSGNWDRIGKSTPNFLLCNIFPDSTRTITLKSEQENDAIHIKVARMYILYELLFAS